MDRIENYRQILEKMVKRHARFQPANGNIQTHAGCDTETGDYMVVDSGWNEKGRRIYDVVIHFRLQDDQVLIERDRRRCRNRPRTHPMSALKKMTSSWLTMRCRFRS